MAGEINLKTLLNTMLPTLCSKDYVFGSLDRSDMVKMADLDPIGTFSEKEGLTVIVEQGRAIENGLHYNGVFKCITLNVHSSLEAVGLTAAISTALAKQGISANVVAAFYHDHVFVPVEDAKSAMETLQELTKS